MNGFTPGPWRLQPGDAPGFKTASGGASILASARPTDDYFILKVAELDTNVPDAERDANARLIAAAPDLLRVLGVLREKWEGDAWVTDQQEMLELTRAAIAKATGETGQ